VPLFVIWAGQCYLTALRVLIAISLPPLFAGIEKLNVITLIFEAAWEIASSCLPRRFIITADSPHSR